MNRNAAHSALVKAIRLDLALCRGLVLWPISPSAPGSNHRTAPVGIADLIGILAPSGRFIALECKTGRAKQNDAQIRWGTLLARHGGFYAVVRSVHDARQAVRQARGRS